MYNLLWHLTSKLNFLINPDTKFTFFSSNVDLKTENCWLIATLKNHNFDNKWGWMSGTFNLRSMGCPLSSLSRLVSRSKPSQNLRMGWLGTKLPVRQLTKSFFSSPKSLRNDSGCQSDWSRSCATPDTITGWPRFHWSWKKKKLKKKLKL